MGRYGSMPARPIWAKTNRHRRGWRAGDGRRQWGSIPARLSSPLAFRQEAVFSRAVKRLALFAHCLAFAGISLALLHKAVFGRAVERLAVAAHRTAFAGLRQSGADRQRGN